MSGWERYRPFMSESAIAYNEAHDRAMAPFIQEQKEREMEERIFNRVMKAIDV